MKLWFDNNSVMLHDQTPKLKSYKFYLQSSRVLSSHDQEFMIDSQKGQQGMKIILLL